MKWKNRLTNYNFWVSIVSALLLVLQACDIKFDVAHINEIITAVLGLLVVIGIINDPTKTNETKTAQKVAVTDTPKSASSANNQEDEIDTASQDDCKDVKQDVYSEIDLANQTTGQVFVAETTPSLEEPNLNQQEISIIEEKVDEQKPIAEIDQSSVDFISQQHCDEGLACMPNNIADVNEVDDNIIPHQPTDASTSYKIVN